MKKIILILIPFFLLMFSSCKKEDNNTTKEGTLTEHQAQLIEFFNDVALGFDNSSISKVTRKWKSTMKVFIGGSPSTELISETKRIIGELNNLFEDGFKIEITENKDSSNLFILFESKDVYVHLYPEEAQAAEQNSSLYYIYWNNNSEIYKGHLFVDIYRLNLTEQKYTLRAALTKALGFTNLSTLFRESILCYAWNPQTEYAEVDKEIIPLLYNSDMQCEYTDEKTTETIKKIFSNQ